MSWPQPRWAPPFATTGLKSTPNLPLIDLRHLSQPELLSLSFCSSSSLHRLQTVTAGVSTPKIDRSVFSRKPQTNFLTLAPRPSQQQRFLFIEFNSCCSLSK
ncbi:hypothetical protein OIU77_019541 [Salix suchowensis]|uniref:Uncharacterized protein n=1 Tax=Salix suchowensis TaxID=1278906 RepID=A0ABQ9CGL3_9ROSI|nr:hypothetical protein OIU78_022267 [Salix suchowensis]KAJ6398792.1 hypothetical protein OIU77_019541 [Salix suchowensis]